MLAVSTAQKTACNVTISELIHALTYKMHNSVLTEPTVAFVLLGDFNVNLMQDTTEKKGSQKYI